jgi:hypothetical protein
MLSPLRLRDSIRPFYDPKTMPTGDVVLAWVRAYVVYANDALAGATKLAVPLVPQGASGNFPVAIDMALRSTWLAASWVGPGLTGKTTLVPPFVPFLLQHASTLIANRDAEAALAAIAQSIHTYTLSITVTVVTAAGAASVVPLA